MTKIKKLIDVDLDDVKTLSIHALVSNDLKFKAYAEKLLRDKAQEIRKKEKKEAK